jgi:hypothetical protein
LINEVLRVGVCHVSLRGKAALTTAFLLEVWSARVRHPNLHRTQPCHAQSVAVLLNS